MARESALKRFIVHGVAEAMNRFNADPDAADTAATVSSNGYSAARGGPISAPMAEPARPLSDDPMHPAPPATGGGRPPKLADRLARPFVRFLELEVASAVLLLLMTLDLLPGELPGLIARRDHAAGVRRSL